MFQKTNSPAIYSLSIILVRFFLILLLIKLTSQSTFCQDFQKAPLITIPGDNINFSIASPNAYQFQDTYICWENVLKSNHTIYLKKINPYSDSTFIVWSDSNNNTNPVISFIYQDQGILIVWQTFIDNHWQLWGRELKNSTLTDREPLTDPQKNSVSPSLGVSGLTWIEDGKLLFTKLLEKPLRTDSITVIDSLNCMNPKIYSDIYYYDPFIIYEKGDTLNKQIYSASYIGQIGQQKPYWRITQESDGLQNKNPAFSLMGGILYETKENDIWKIIYGHYYGYDLLKSNNVSCNYEHPGEFVYPIPTKTPPSPLDGPFVTFDSDSLKDNKEVIAMLQSYPADSIINLSNSPGDDYKPVIALLYAQFNDTKVSVIWQHTDNGKTDIWWAYVSFIFPHGDVKGYDSIKIDFVCRNYPNPFNQSTIINYSIPAKALVTLKVFDLLGREIKELVNVVKEKGNYSFPFDASGLASGVYLYRITAGKFSMTNKMILTK